MTTSRFTRRAVTVIMVTGLAAIVVHFMVSLLRRKTGMSRRLAYPLVLLFVAGLALGGPVPPDTPYRYFRNSCQ